MLPGLFPFVVRDYNSHFGFDGLAARNKALAINETEHLFVEFKTELAREFNHSFDCLESILCWTSCVRDGEIVTDLSGKTGTYSITTGATGKRRFIVRSDGPRNVEVIALKELLAWIPEPSATGLREADLNVLAKLGEQGLEWRLEAEAFARREVCGEDDLLDFLFGHSVDIQVTRQPST